MKRLCLLMLSLILLLSATAVVPQAPSPSPVSAAGAIWGQLQAVSWGAPYAEWQRAHSQLACRAYSWGEDGRSPDELWAYRCAQAAQPVTAEWLFYALSLNEPVTARLEQFRAVVAGLSPAMLKEAHRELSGCLSSRYGAADDPGSVEQFGSAYWRDLWRWRSGDLEILLYLFEPPRAPPCLEIMVRRRPLLDSLAAEQRLQDLVFGDSCGCCTPLDIQLAKQLGAEFPALASLLADEQAGRDYQLGGQALIELIEAAETSSPERRAMLLLAADRLADRLFVTERQSPGWDQVRKQLAACGLNFEWDELGGGWGYTHDLLWRVWEDYQGTPWGEQAFLLIENRGWEPHVGCGSGSDQFRMVIRNGERFLREHPQTPHRPDILLALAQAYETWWSVSQAGANDEYVDPTRYQEGAADARQKAIQYYEQVLRAAPASDHAAYVRLELPRLKLGLDTFQRRFFCVYD